MFDPVSIPKWKPIRIGLALVPALSTVTDFCHPQRSGGLNQFSRSFSLGPSRFT
jgi:hypothetical protein